MVKLGIVRFHIVPLIFKVWIVLNFFLIFGDFEPRCSFKIVFQNQPYLTERHLHVFFDVDSTNLEWWKSCARAVTSLRFWVRVICGVRCT